MVRWVLGGFGYLSLAALVTGCASSASSFDTREVARADATPGTRAGHVLVYDARRGRTLLLGGDTRDAPLSETIWSWDGRTWRPLITDGPRQRSLAAAAFDTRRGVLVVYGGIGLRTGTIFGDTWEWDGTRWREPIVRTAGARDHHAFAYDEARGQLVVFGGAIWDRSLPNDTWTWDGSTWVRADTTTGPGGRFHHAMAYDRRRQRVVLFGGGNNARGYLDDTWEWDGHRWTRLTVDGPSPRARHRMTYDNARGTIVLHGGTAEPAPGTRGFRYLEDTWTFDGARWRQVSADGPGARCVHAMAFDEGRARVVLYGGSAPDGQLGDTWEWDGQRWTRVGGD
jgi:hypothetical protein